MSKPWQRGAVAVELLILALGGLVGLGGVVASRSPAVRKAVLARVAAEVETRYGIAVAATDFRWDAGENRLVLDDLRFGEPGAAPVLTARRAVVGLSLKELRSSPPRLRSVELEAPILDLSAPFPELGGGDEAAGSGGGGIEIGRFAVTDGTLSNLVVGGEEEVAARLSAAGVRIVGALTGGRLTVRLVRSRVEIVADPLGTRAGSLVGAMAGPAAGPWRFEGVELTLAGLAARLSGEAGTAAEDPLRFDFEIDGDAAALLPDRGLDGAGWRAAGALDLRAQLGEVRLAARAVPAPALAALLPDPASLPPLAGLALDLDADLALGPGALTRVAGVATVSGQRGGERLFEVEARPEVASEGEIRLPLDLRLLPAAAGERRLRATLVAASAAELETGRWEDGRLTLRLPRLAALPAQLDKLWPGLAPREVRGELERRGPAGLTLAAAFDGPLTAPAGTLDGRVTLPAGELRLAGSGSLASGRADLSVDARAVDLAFFAFEGLAGVLDGRIEARRSDTGLPSLTADLTARGLVYGGQPPLERLAVVARSEGALVRISRLEIDNGETSVRGSGELALAAPLRPPLTGGRIDLKLMDPRLGASDTTLVAELAAGVLDVELSLDPENRGGELEARVPVGVLGAGVDGLVAEPAAGEIDLGWRLPPRDWGELLARFGVAAPETLRFASSGSLRFDPARPLDAAGAAMVEALAITGEGIDLAVPGELHLEIESGRLTLPPAAIVLGGETILLGATGALDGDRLAVALDPIGLGGCWGRLEVDAPVPEGLAELRVAAGPAAGADPSFGLDFRLPACDLGGLAARLAELDEPLDLTAGLVGSARFDPAAPAAGEASIAITGLDGRVEGQRVRQVGAIEIGLADARLRLADTELELGGQPMVLAAVAELDPAYAPGSPLSDLVRTVDVTARGGLEAAILEPFLAGGVASGQLDVDLQLAGPVDALAGSVRIDGPDASLLYASPYRTRIQAPRLVVRTDAGSVRLDGSELTLNEGRVQLLGGFDTAGAVDLKVVLSEIKYRLDYGLLVTLGGTLDWTGEATGDSTLGGSIRVARGTLTRPIELDRRFVADLLAPVDLTGSGGSPLQQVALDLEVSTREGVRVRNNLADLLVLWEPIKVRGNLETPLVEGTLEVQPGGLVYAPGQTLRLEKASIRYSGRPGEAPEAEFATTSTVDQPEFSRDTVLATGPESVSGADGEAGLTGLTDFSQGLALFYGEQVASRVGEALGGTEISLRPIPVFGETDPAARLNLSRDFTRRISVVASIDLREAEGQTYILDLSDLPYIPSLRTQLFTLDDGTEGATMTQSIELGGRAPSSEPEIRKLAISGRPPGVSKRGFKRALRLEEGDTLGEGDRFAAEVDTEEYLRGRGYPSARVAVSAEPSPKKDGGIELSVRIEAGKRVGFRFAGVKPPDRLRGTIRSLYRDDLWEEASIEEMRQQTIRIFRSQGHLDPTVEITVVPAEPGDEVDRWIVIASEPGRRVEPTAPVFAGLPEDESAYVASRFWGPVQRTELALGLGDAERRALAALAELGYPRAALVDRRLSDDGEQFVVEVEPGPRQTIVHVDVEGFEGPLPEPELAVGDPARADRIAAGAARLRRELEGRGYVDARVWARRTEEPGDPLAVRVEYQVEAGRSLRFGEPSFEGLGATRRRWAGAVANLPAGETFTEADMRSAKRRLYRTGLFSSVATRIERTADGDLADVVFEVEERPRYLLSYGLRWDTDDGVSLVLDATDSNFVGRGIQLGARALYSDRDSSFRISLQMPRFLGGKGELRWFNLVRRETDELLATDLITNSFESTLQYDHPLGRSLRGRVYVSWLDTRVREEDPDPFFPLDERFQSPVLGTQLLYDRRGPGILPRTGLFASLDVSGSSQALGSDFRYLRAFAQVYLFRTLAERGQRALVWAQSYRLGGAEAFDQRLVRDRFFAGGPFSVRGYPTQSLGPTETIGGTETSIGGESLLVLNQELRLTVLVDRLTAVVFFDAGNVWEELDQTDTTLFTSAGIGVRAITPVGLLRLDLARPLDRRLNDPEYKIHFGFGTLF